MIHGLRLSRLIVKVGFFGLLMERRNGQTPLISSLLAAIIYIRQLRTARLSSRLDRNPPSFGYSPLSRMCVWILLADAGYCFVDPSLVLYQNAEAVQDEAASPASLERSLWLEAYCDLSSIDINSQRTHAEILARIPSSSLFAILEDKGQPVACGLGVICEEYFGIFDLVTKEQARNQGYGTRLVKSMISWAKCCNAQYLYLQVTAQNTAAIHFYEKLGYRYLYHYWYRVQGSRK